jgi:ATP-binding cassette subfamily B protein
VDSEAEAEIQRALAVLMRGRTTIAIAHRLSTVVGANEILVLHHGEVRERGTHVQLRSMHGLYDRLYRLQAGEVTGSGSVPTIDVKASSTALASPLGGG